MRKENSDIQLILMDGSILIGTVRGFDNFTVILSNQSGQHLVYKHAIAQIIHPRIAQRRDDSNASDSNAPGCAGSREMDQTREHRDGFNKLDLSGVATPGQVP